MIFILNYNFLSMIPEFETLFKEMKFSITQTQLIYYYFHDLNAILVVPVSDEPTSALITDRLSQRTY